jgi:hypothetical protein
VTVDAARRRGQQSATIRDGVRIRAIVTTIAARPRARTVIRAAAIFDDATHSRHFCQKTEAARGVLSANCVDLC